MLWCAPRYQSVCSVLATTNLLIVGLINYGVEFEKYTRGILGSVILGSANITSGLWLQTGGLQGEQLQIYTPQNLNSVSWYDYRGDNSFHTKLTTQDLQLSRKWLFYIQLTLLQDLRFCSE